MEDGRKQMTANPVQYGGTRRGHDSDLTPIQWDEPGYFLGADYQDAERLRLQTFAREFPITRETA
jgi:hypothetical protein